MRVTSPTMWCGANVRIGFWTELSGSAAARTASRASSSARSPCDGEPEPPLVVERQRVAVGERERRRVGAARGAPHRGLADALEPRLRPLGPAAGADRRAVRVAVEAALHRLVVARRRRHRRDRDVLDPDRDRVADLGALDRDRRADLVAAADRRRDHRAPAAGRRVPHDVAAVGDRARPARRRARACRR